MTSLVLEVNKRNLTGKAVRKLRKAGAIPAVLYGKAVSAIALEVPKSKFLRIFREAGENTVLKLAIADAGNLDVRDVLIHQVAADPLSGDPLHVDFYQVRLDEAVRVMVPLIFTGESAVVKNEAGVLVRALQEIEVEALPGKIPEAIEVDISRLATFDHAIHVSDLSVPAGVKVITPLGVTVAMAQPPRTGEELKALDETPLKAAAPEVMTEAEVKKKAAEEAAAAAAAAEQKK